MLCTLADTCIKPAPDFGRLELVLTRRGVPDRVPFYELFMDHEIIRAALGRPALTTADIVDFYFRAGYDYAPAYPALNLGLGSLVDSSLGYPVRDWESLEKHPWPTPESVDYSEFEAMTKLLPDGMKLVAQTSGVFEALEGLFGYENLCYLLFDDPDLVRAAGDYISAIYEPMYKTMAEFDAVGAVVISDDLGYKTQTLIAPDDLRLHVLPRHRRLAELIHGAGKQCILHSCGNLDAVMEDIIGWVGIDAKHSYEDAVMPVTEAKRVYEGRIAILGGFDLDRLCRSTEEEVRAYTRTLVEELGRDGGYALGSGNTIAPYVPVTNYLAMLDEAWRIAM